MYMGVFWKNFHWFLGKGMEDKGMFGENMLNGFLGKGLEGKGMFGGNMLNGFWENDILQLHIHPPSPLRGRGALRRDEATKKQRYALLFCRLASCQVA